MSDPIDVQPLERIDLENMADGLLGRVLVIAAPFNMKMGGGPIIGRVLRDTDGSTWEVTRADKNNRVFAPIRAGDPITVRVERLANDFELLAVLVGARARVAHAYARVDEATCCCCEREENDVPPTVPYPAADKATWCFLCAVESEQKALGVTGNAFGQALAEIAFGISGERFTLMQVEARDRVLFDAFETWSQDQALAAFDEATNRRALP